MLRLLTGDGIYNHDTQQWLICVEEKSIIRKYSQIVSYMLQNTNKSEGDLIMVKLCLDCGTKIGMLNNDFSRKLPKKSLNADQVICKKCFKNRFVCMDCEVDLSKFALKNIISPGDCSHKFPKGYIDKGKYICYDCLMKRYVCMDCGLYLNKITLKNEIFIGDQSHKFPDGHIDKEQFICYSCGKKRMIECNICGFKYSARIHVVSVLIDHKCPMEDSHGFSDDISKEELSH